MTDQRRRLAILILATALLWTPVDHLAASSTKTHAGSQRELSWVTPTGGGEVIALALDTVAKKHPALISRMLVQHADHRFVVTTIVDRLQGFERVHLLDDASGWWIEIRTQYGIRGKPGEEYPQFYRRLHEWMEPGQGHEQVFRVVTSDGFRASESIPVARSSQPELRALRHALQRDGRWQELSDSVPATVASSLPVLSKALEQTGSEVKPFALLANSDTGTATGRLVFSEGPSRRGTRPSSPLWQRLIQEYDHFDPDDPFPNSVLDLTP